jgi:uncharacterized protein YndB with AHSA1/START domain
MTTTASTVPALEVTRTFDAAPARVFDAWLSKSWGEWAGPSPVRGEVVLMEPRVGGRYRVVMHMPDGNTLTVGGTYREIVRHSKLVFTWKWEHETVETLVTLQFRAAGGKTVMHITHQGFEAQERRDSHGSGWSGTFDKLAAHLAKAA